MSPPIVCLENPPTRSGVSDAFPYSVVVPHSERPGQGAARRSGLPSASSGPSLAMHGCMTSYECFRRGALLYRDLPCLGHREVDSRGQATPFVFQTYGEVERRIDNLAAGLRHAQLMKPNPDGMRLLGIYCRNRPEWVIAEQACFADGGMTVPMYDTLGPDTLEFILRQTGLSAMICSGSEELARIASAAANGKCPSLRHAIVIDGATPQEIQAAERAGVDVHTMAELEAEGAAHPGPNTPPAPQDVATFCYTSGTTGDPKGALILHSSLVSVNASLLLYSPMYSSDVYLSFLPLPHIYERTMQLGALTNGASIGFFRGNPLLLIEDIIALRPTVLASVPRILNRIHDKVVGGMLAAGGLKASLFRRACQAKVAGLHHGTLTHCLWDRIIFNKVKTALGMDRIRLMATGSAPIATHVLTFMRILLGCEVLEGYGQTETCAAATVTLPGDYSTGHVGGPLPCVEICLKDVPEMGYLHTDSWHGPDPEEGGKGGMPCAGRGEICFRGTSVFPGYYAQPEKTAEAIGTDGWLHSGDIGLWTADGSLKIIDRKKNIFKLAQGEYVAPEKIENIHTQSPLVAQSFVYGDSLQSSLVCIIVPDPEYSIAWGKSQGLTLSFPALCASKEFKAHVMQELKIVGDRSRLAGFERVKAIHLDAEPFTAENGLLTPTMKLKRVEAREHYRSLIDTMYASMPQAGGLAKL